MKIIAIDSSGLVASVAIVQDEEVIAEYNVQYKKTHSQTLQPMLDELKRMVDLYGTDKVVCPIMDARRNQVYTGLYSYIEDGQSDEQEQSFHYTLVPILSQCAVPIEEIAEKCNEQQKEIIFLGDGVPVFAEQLKNLMKVPYSFAPAHMNRQRAASFAFLAFEKLRKGEVVPAADHAPEYLRLSQAEREKAAKREKQ